MTITTYCDVQQDSGVRLVDLKGEDSNGMEFEIRFKFLDLEALDEFLNHFKNSPHGEHSVLSAMTILEIKNPKS